MPPSASNRTEARLASSSKARALCAGAQRVRPATRREIAATVYSSMPRTNTSRLVSMSLFAIAAILASCSADRRALERTTGKILQDLSGNDLHGMGLPPKTVVLTFDDGPGPRTSELSAYLHTEGIHATFFLNGGHLAPTALPNPNGLTAIPGVAALLAQLEADGHIVANHTVTHRNLVTTVLPMGAQQLVQELAETDDSIAPYVRRGQFLFRAPFGSYNTAVFNALQPSAMSKYVGPINWDVGGRSEDYPNQAADWACFQGQLYSGAALANGTGFATTTQCGDAYLQEIAQRGRGIVLLHEPYSWANGNTVDMVKYMVPILKAGAYTFAGLEEVPEIAALLPPRCDTTCATCTGPLPSQCSTCEIGRYFDAGTCAPCAVCPFGAYPANQCTPTANTGCASCDAACTTCTAAGPNACSSCPATAFLDATTCRPCAKCAAERYETTACTATTDSVCSACSSTCATCRGPGPQDCGSCPANTFLLGGACVPCTTCEAGSYQANACTATRDTRCEVCAAGTVSATPSTRACLPCAAGTAQPKLGQSTCETCPAGTFSRTGASECTACAPNTYASSPRSSECLPCPATSTSAKGASSCTEPTAPAPPQTDASTDGSSPPPDGSTPDGMGCTVVRGPSGSTPFVLFGASGILLLVRRRRSSRAAG
jgi:peptidoglycan/xylan/chitin deacetylase (PgdA/CDA1 family)